MLKFKTGRRPRDPAVSECLAAPEPAHRGERGRVRSAEDSRFLTLRLLLATLAGGQSSPASGSQLDTISGRCQRGWRRLSRLTFQNLFDRWRRLQVAKPDSPARVGEPECRKGGLIYEGLPRLFSDETKVASVVPHGPPDVVHVERAADVRNPAHPVGGRCDTPIDTELITHYANIPLLRPRGRLFNFSPNACSAPLLVPVPDHQQFGQVVGE